MTAKLPTYDTVAIYMDTREKQGKKNHILLYMEDAGIPVIRHKLLVGDWTRTDDQSVCIDTKTCGMQEVYSNLISDHARFRRECVRAVENGIRLIVLVEEYGITSLEDVKKWQNPREGLYYMRKAGFVAGRGEMPKAPPVSSERLYNIMRVMAENYRVEWEFTTHDKAGERICGILGLSPNSSSKASPPGPSGKTWD